MDNTLSTVANLLRQAKRILFITGAGLSADSGLPTYRGIGGLYEGQDTQEGIPIEDALSGQMLRQRPDLTWKYLWQIGKALQGATYNQGHQVIAEIERQKPETWVLTQNVDGLHRAAGSQNLIEVHGRVNTLYCVDCGIKTLAQNLWTSDKPPESFPPKCSACGGVIRPDVVLFGELLPFSVMDQMERLANQRMDIVFSVGTSALFPYIAEPVLSAHKAGIPTVEINPCSTNLSQIVDYPIRMTAAQALSQLWEAVQTGFDEK